MKTCHGCNHPLEPLAAVRTYHAGCDPRGRGIMLERALRELSYALMGARNIFSKYEDKLAAQERLNNAEEAARAALAYKPAQMKEREG